MLDLLLPLGVLFILLLALRSFLQLIQNWFLNRTVREALEKHPENVPMILEKLQSMSGTWRQDAFGMAMLAAGLALVAAALLDQGAERLMLVQFALLPLFIGAALLLHYRFVRGRPS